MADRFEVDIFIFVECTIPTANLLGALNAGPKPTYRVAESLCEAVTIYTRFSTESFAPVHESSRFTIRRLALQGRNEILVAGIHLPSGLYFEREGIQYECFKFAETIRQQEQLASHSRTIVVGDLNMNPFDPGVVAAIGLHGVMTRKTAVRGHRRVQGTDYPFFYNPMWGHFGDGNDGAPGTYYYERADHNVLFWNMFDQILLRPDLLDAFDNRELKILTTDGYETLLSDQGRPDGTTSSDHLPILFKLDF